MSRALEESRLRWKNRALYLLGVKRHLRLALDSMTAERDLAQAAAAQWREKLAADMVVAHDDAVRAGEVINMLKQRNAALEHINANLAKSAQAEQERLIAERDCWENRFGHQQDAYLDQAKHIEKLDAQLAEAHGEIARLKADYDDTRKELNRVANLLFDECQTLASLTEEGNKAVEDAAHLRDLRHQDSRMYNELAEEREGLRAEIVKGHEEVIFWERKVHALTAAQERVRALGVYWRTEARALAVTTTLNLPIAVRTIQILNDCADKLESALASPEGEG